MVKFMSKNLALKQLDRQFKAWSVLNVAIPKQGWVRTLRKALGMTGQQLANRLGVTRSRVVRLEEDEPRGAVTLKTLNEVAEALNCHLVYCFVPKDSLQNILRTQASKIAHQRMKRVTHTMQLENQSLGIEEQEELETELVEELLKKSLKHLWEE